MKKIILLSLIFISHTNAMDIKKAHEPKLHVLAIPGQNGLGSHPDYVSKLLGEENVSVTDVATPNILPDLGQGFCMKHLAQSVNSSQAQQSIVHATSQGTATALNYVGNIDKGKRVKALILEAVLASGNSAIHHTVTGPLMGIPADKIPFSHYWLPYPAMIACRGYLPGGKQAIKSIAHIPTDMPIIIAHSTEDMQLPVSGACALYYGLREQGNNNVYFFIKDGKNHVHICDVNSGNKDGSIIRRILAKHKLLPASNKSDAEIDLSPYQPDHKPFKAEYDALISQEKNHERLACALTIGALYKLYRMGMAYFGM